MRRRERSTTEASTERNAANRASSSSASSSTPMVRTVAPRGPSRSCLRSRRTRCSRVASKENRVDIEGLAVKDGRLYFGFRGPVLRDGWVPILVTAWDDVDAAEVRYVQLDGRGIRDIAVVDDGFLILAGPVAMPTCRTASTSGTVAMSSPREAMTRGRKGSPSFPSSKAASRGTRGARYARQNV